MNNNQWQQQQIRQQQEQQRRLMMGADWERRQREMRKRELENGGVFPSYEEKSRLGRVFSIVFYLVLLYLIFYFVMEAIG